MNIDQNTLILVLIFSLPLYFIFFICGWLVGRTSSLQHFGSQSVLSKTISSKNNKKLSEISIDEKTIVTDISTEGMEKKYNNIANTVQSDHKIQDSVSKLKNLKK
jgi:hypothetical protein